MSDALAILLRLVHLLIKEGDDDLSVGALQFFFTEPSIIVGLQRELQNFVPFGCRTFVHIRTFDDRKLFMVSNFYLHVGFYLGCVDGVEVGSHNHGRRHIL